MNIIKTSDAASANFEFSAQTADLEYGERIKHAEDTAAQIIADAQAAADEIKQQAYEAGLNDAELQLRADLHTRANVLGPLLDSFSTQLQQSQNERLLRAEKSVLPLAAALARKAMNRELQHQPCPSTELVREAVELISGAESFQIYVAPEAVQGVRQVLHEVVQELPSVPQIKIHADETLAAGDLVLRTEHGVVDQRCETRLARIISELEAA